MEVGMSVDEFPFDIFGDKSDQDDGPVCSVCGNALEPWEQNERDGSPVCNYHDDRWDKD
jgi:hypothetical protein